MAKKAKKKGKQKSKKVEHERPRERDVSCCEFRVLAHGGSRSTLTALRDAVDLDLTIDASVGADSSSIGAVPPNPAASSSDSDGEHKVVSRQQQGPDRIGKVDEYTVTWEVINTRAPTIVEIELSGNAEARMHCAQASGTATFSDVRVRKQDDSSKGATRVVVTARNACDEVDRCEFVIREP